MTALNPFWDHLWQSSLVAVLIGVTIPLFRNNSARVRYGLWLAASLKFLAPFSLFAAMGSMVFVQTVPPGSMAIVGKMRTIAMPFSVAPPATAGENIPWLEVFLVVWLLGAASVAVIWLVRWCRLQAVVRAARRLAFDLPIPVKSVRGPLEPGLVGIVRPVILMPEGILDRLSRSEIDAILTHELCHWRRHDNLLAALHMLVACIFWFHPVVWFIGGRLVEERERACDEDVLECRGNPQAYAETILKVCRLYVHSPLACAAGVSGADLDRRITAIMAGRELLEISSARKALLGTLLAASLITPFAAGSLKPAPVAEVARGLARVLVPLARKDSVPQPVNVSARPHDAGRHRARNAISPSSIQIHEASLVAPTINVTPTFIFAATPQLDTHQPVATDNPGMKVCRPPQQLPDSRLFGPQVCLSESEWERIRQQGLVLMPDGRTLRASYQKENSLTGRICSYAGVSASSVSSWPVTCF